jgi:hypothetical protein
MHLCHLRRRYTHVYIMHADRGFASSKHNGWLQRRCEDTAKQNWLRIFMHLVFLQNKYRSQDGLGITH